MILTDLKANTAREAQSAIADPLERRAWVRYRSDLEAACRARGSMRNAGWTAKIRNISAGGLGLLLHHRFRPGTPLSVELKNQTGTFCRIVEARVVHATSVMTEDGHGWLLGCAFEKPLSDGELQALL